MERKRPLDPRVGQIVRTMRQRHGLSLRQLAKQIGLAPSTLEGYEQGTSRIPIEQLARVAQALKIAVSAFLPGASSANGLAETLWQVSTDLSRETHPANIIDALHYTVKEQSGLDVASAWRAEPKKICRIWDAYHVRRPVMPESDWLEYFALAREHDPSVVAQKIWRNDGPFTLRQVNPSGSDQWVKDFYELRGRNDGFYCPCGLWTLMYSSREELSLSGNARALLFTAAIIAASRLEEIFLAIDFF